MEVSNAEGGEIGTYAKKQSNNTTAVIFRCLRESDNYFGKTDNVGFTL